MQMYVETILKPQSSWGSILGLCEQLRATQAAHPHALYGVFHPLIPALGCLKFEHIRQHGGHQFPGKLISPGLLSAWSYRSALKEVVH